MNKAELIKALAELLAEKMEIGEEPTNGEVIQALFPNIDVRLFTDANIVQVKILELDSYWWNAPYNIEK